ncbi:MAG: GFA family protein [Alcanivorax sp.]|nr:GFA family protein [Alcanivorax sp.]
MTTYTGSCHCGAVRFQADGELRGAMACNCSLCQRRGSLLWFVPADNFRVLEGRDSLASYTFHKHVMKHRFCPVCGIHTFCQGVDARGNAMVAVNIRCLEGINLGKVPIKHFDGRAL